MLHFVKVDTVLCFAFCFERILGKMVNSVLLLVAWIERYFELLQSTLNCIGVHTSSLIKTSNSALNSVVNATLSLETRYAAWQLITSFSFNPLSNNINRGLSAAVLYRNEEHITRLTLYTTEDSSLSHNTYPIVCTLTILALINFQSLATCVHTPNQPPCRTGTNLRWQGGETDAQVCCRYTAYYVIREINDLK